MNIETKMLVIYICKNYKPATFKNTYRIQKCRYCLDMLPHLSPPSYILCWRLHSLRWLPTLNYWIRTHTQELHNLSNISSIANILQIIFYKITANFFFLNAIFFAMFKSSEKRPKKYNFCKFLHFQFENYRK